MYNEIKAEEASLPDKIEVKISFDESAIDELMKQAIEKEEPAGALAFRLAKKLEYGLKLVKDRSGMESFTLNREAVSDMERYINDLVKTYYKNQTEPEISIVSEDSEAQDEDKGREVD